MKRYWVIPSVYRSCMLSFAERSESLTRYTSELDGIERILFKYVWLKVRIQIRYRIFGVMRGSAILAADLELNSTRSAFSIRSVSTSAARQVSRWIYLLNI